jgi:helix-turn-helix protein
VSAERRARPISSSSGPAPTSNVERRGALRDGRTKDWFYCNNAIFDREDLSAHAKLTYTYLCRCAGDGDTCFPSFRDIARKTGYSHGTVGNALQELKQAGLIQREPRRTELGRQTSTEYVICRVQAVNTVDSRVHQVDAVQGVHPMAADRVHQVDTKKTLEPEVEVKKNTPTLDGAADQAPQAQGLLLVEGEAVKGPHGPARQAEGSTHAVAAPGSPAASVAPTPISPAAAAPARAGHAAIAPYYDRWRAHHGKTPTITPKRVGILNRIFKGLGPEASEEYPRLLDALFSSPDNFIITNAHSPEVFETKLDALRVNGNGHARRGAAAPEAPSGRQSKRINDKFFGAVTGRVSL